MIELIAECATNHGGSVPLAKEFASRFIDAGADWIKYQYTRVAHLRPSDPQFDWMKQSELQDDQFAELKAHCESLGKKFLLTVYNAQDVPAVAKLSTEAIKIGAGEAHEQSLADAVLATPVGSLFISKGLTTGKPYWGKWPRVTFFGCCSRYPHPPIEAQGSFDIDTRGWSDHSVGLDTCELAILRGAQLIEKHVQLANQARPCKPYEASVEEFRQLRAFADDDPSRFLGRWQYGSE